MGIFERKGVYENWYVIEEMKEHFCSQQQKMKGTPFTCMTPG